MPPAVAVPDLDATIAEALGAHRHDLERLVRERIDAALDAFSRPSDLVFCTVAGKPLSERNIRARARLREARAKLDTPDDRLSMHALRHSFLSLAATTLDVPDTTLARIAGHANPAITMRLYARDRRDQNRVNEDVLARAAQAGFAS